MLKILTISLLFLASCTKHPVQSQEERERSEPLKENEIIEDGAIRIKLTYTNATIELSGDHLQTTQPYVNYFIESMGDNTETFVYANYTGSGTFDATVEGFTASTNSKRFYLKGVPIGSGKKPFLRITKGIVKYTFYRL